MKEAKQGNPMWKRTGAHIVYYRNNIKNNQGRQHYTLSFDFMFPHGADTVYIAYHYPYTYTRLRAELAQIKREFTIQIDLNTTYVTFK